jgi:hypothetical protein
MNLINFIKKTGKQIFFVYTVIHYVIYNLLNKLSWLPGQTKDVNYFSSLLITGAFLSFNILALMPNFFHKSPKGLFVIWLLTSIINYFLFYHKGKNLKIIDYFEKNKPSDIYYLVFLCYIIFTFLLFSVMDFIRSLI